MAALLSTVLSCILFGFLTPGFQPEGEPPAPPPPPPAAEAEADAEAQDPPQRPRAGELAPNLGWFNTDKPLLFTDQLKGQVVVLDFWTSCCVNCMHTTEDLKRLEEKYANEPVVFIGVHSAKFLGETPRSAVRAAVQRYGIRHPVVIDDHMAIWQAYDVRAWPSFVVVGPDGLVLAQTFGEGRRDMLDAAIRNVLEYGRKRGTLADKPLRAAVDAGVPSAGGLAFPGKVHAVPPTKVDSVDAQGWLFIADSSHHRVIAATWPDADGRSRVVRVIGGGDSDSGGESGFIDGPPELARFHRPQGLAYDAARNVLYVADTVNHAVRSVNIFDGSVRTLAGDGTRGLDFVGGKSGREQPLASPWDVALSPDGATLAVAMAGLHQLWSINLATGRAEPIAGAGSESIFDGPAGEASLAQPSGLAFSKGGERLYFVDAETSSLRVLDLKEKQVKTIVGADLFVFGDGDGPGRRALLQHPLGVSLLEPGTASETVVVADSFNHILRLVDGPTRDVTLWLGVRRTEEAVPGTPRFDEPGGVHVAGEGAAQRVFVADTNNHRVLVIDPATRAWREVTLTGLEPADAQAAIPVDAKPVTVALSLGTPVQLRIEPPLEPSIRVNPEVPFTVVVREVEASGRLGVAVVQRTDRTETLPVSVTIPGAAVHEGKRWLVEASFGVCAEGSHAVCTPASAAWIVTVTSGSEAVGQLR